MAIFGLKFEFLIKICPYFSGFLSFREKIPYCWEFFLEFEFIVLEFLGKWLKKPAVTAAPVTIV